jgi:hypothetical protein
MQGLYDVDQEDRTCITLAFYVFLLPHGSSTSSNFA